MHLFSIPLLFYYWSLELSHSYPDLMTCHRYPSMGFQNLRLMGSTSDSYSIDNNITINGVVLNNNIGNYTPGSRILISLSIFENDDDDRIYSVFQANNGAYFEGSLNSRYHNGLIAGCNGNNTANISNSNNSSSDNISRYQMYDKSSVVLQTPQTGGLITIECNYAENDTDSDGDDSRVVFITFPVTLYPKAIPTSLPLLSPTLQQIYMPMSSSSTIPSSLSLSQETSSTIIPTVSSSSSRATIVTSPSLSSSLLLNRSTDIPTISPTTIILSADSPYTQNKSSIIPTLLNTKPRSAITYFYDDTVEASLTTATNEPSSPPTYSPTHSLSYASTVSSAPSTLTPASMPLTSAPTTISFHLIQQCQANYQTANHYYNSNKNNKVNALVYHKGFFEVHQYLSNTTASQFQSVIGANESFIQAVQCVLSNYSSVRKVNVTITAIDTVQSIRINQQQTQQQQTQQHASVLTSAAAFSITAKATTATTSIVQTLQQSVLNKLLSIPSIRTQEQRAYIRTDDSYVHLHYIVEFLFSTTSTSSTTSTITDTDIEDSENEDEEVEEDSSTSDKNSNTADSINFQAELKQLKIVYDGLINQLSNSITDNTFILIFKEYLLFAQNSSDNNNDDNGTSTGNKNKTNTNSTDGNVAYDYIDDDDSDNGSSSMIFSFATSKANILPTYFPPYLLTSTPSFSPTTTNNNSNKNQHNHHNALSSAELLKIIIAVAVLVCIIFCFCILLAFHSLYRQYKRQRQKDIDKWLQFQNDKNASYSTSDSNNNYDSVVNDITNL